MEAQNQELKLGKSILVPSVQELVAKQALESVPERYIQPNNQDIPILSVNDYANDLQLPIIDMDLLLNGDDFELEKLHSACQEWGFFQLVNHGIDKKLVESFKLETQNFFHLPMEEKKIFWQTSTEVEGFGQAFVVSEEQKLDWADMFLLTALPKHLRKPNLLPMLPLPYRITLESYSVELQNLAMKLLDCMSRALKIDNEIMRSFYGDDGLQSIRINYYPPCPQPDKVIGLTPHSDPVALTILLQFDETEGLQIMKYEKWVPVKSLPNAFVVNVGDILEIMTNGKYRSILHRAVVNETKARISVAAFHDPAVDREIGPIPELITPTNPARFRRINMGDYLTGLFTRALDRKSYLDYMRIDDITTSSVLS